jgi:Flp pilus assembly protein TadB
VVTATTGGAGNIPVSIAEDIISTVLSVLAIVIPILVAVIVALGIVLLIWWLGRRRAKANLTT